jgi:hypothetical protein
MDLQRRHACLIRSGAVSVDSERQPTQADRADGKRSGQSNAAIEARIEGPVKDRSLCAPVFGRRHMKRPANQGR